MRSYQGFTFSTRIHDGIPRDNQRDEKENVWQVGNPQRFLLHIMRSHQDLTFSTRIQDGTPRDNQRDKKENVWQVENP